MKNTIKKFLKEKIRTKAFLIIASFFTAMSLFYGCSSNNSNNNPETHRKIELEKNCTYILPAKNQRENYLLDGRGKAEVHYYDNWWRADWMGITLNDKVKLFSENFEGEKWQDNARTLDAIMFKISGEWRRFPKERIQNYESWQKTYEELIEEIAEKQLEHQKNALENYFK